MSPADVALSKGPKPVNPKLVIKDVLGRPVGVWTGKVVTK